MGTILVAETNHTSSDLVLGINAIYDKILCEEATWGLESVQIELK
jgi:hypothetical protein